MRDSILKRPVIEVFPQNLPKVFAPQAVIVKGVRADGMTFRVDIGRLCYLEREDNITSYRKRNSFIVKDVNTKSLCKERVEWFRNYLNVAFHKDWRNETLRQELHCLRYFFDFCDFEGGLKPTAFGELIMEFQRYQIQLGQRIRLKGSYSLRSFTITRRLNSVRSFIQWAFGLSDSEMLSFIPKHRHRKAQIEAKFRVATLDEGQDYLRACAIYFNQFCDAILENKYPVKVTPPNSKDEDLYWHAARGTTLKKLPNCFKGNGDPLPYESIKEIISKNFKSGNTSKADFYNKTLIYNRNEWMTGKLTIQKIYSYNLSVFCFFQLYLGFTAANIQPTLDLKIGDIDLRKVGSNTFAKKHKYRAGRYVDFTAPSQLKRELLKYLKLREWVDRLGWVGDTNEYLFVSIGKDKKLKRLDRSSAYSLIRQSPLFEGIPQVSSKDLRQLAGEYFIRKSQGKISLVAKKLNNSVATVARSYTAIDIEAQAKEMNGYHEELTIQIRRFNRTTDNLIPIKLSSKKSSERIASGACTNFSGEIPSRSKGFNDKAPAPACGTFESCLFCEHFALHEDHEDIHKILSLREALRLTSEIRNDPEHHEAVVQPALFRIDEIVEFLTKNNDWLVQVVDKVEVELKMGNYNKHWSKPIEILIQQLNNTAGGR